MPKQVENAASDDYLSAIYRLTHDEGLEAFAVRLSDRLSVTPPSCLLYTSPSPRD